MLSKIILPCPRSNRAISYTVPIILFLAYDAISYNFTQVFMVLSTKHAIYHVWPASFQIHYTGVPTRRYYVHGRLCIQWNLSFDSLKLHYCQVSRSWSSDLKCETEKPWKRWKHLSQSIAVSYVLLQLYPSPSLRTELLARNEKKCLLNNKLISNCDSCAYCQGADMLLSWIISRPPKRCLWNL